MRVMIYSLIVCVGVTCAGVALAEPVEVAPAAPKVSAEALYQDAEAQYSSGSYEKAAELIGPALKTPPKDPKLRSLPAKVRKALFTKGSRLLSQRDYAGALDAYDAYLKVLVPDRDYYTVKKIVKDLGPVRTTSLEITVANGPAVIYLESRTLGEVCKAAPSCTKAWLPGDYDVIAERPGFEPWTRPVTIASGVPTKLPITLIEKPSLLAVRGAPEGATITVDDTAHDAARPIPAGKHQVVVSLAGHAKERREVVAREGKPIELDVVLTPLVPVQIEPAGAELLLGGKPVAIQDGGIPVPPGAHKLVARAGGFQDRQVDLPAERGADYKLVIKLDQAAVVPPAPGGPVIFTGRRKIALAAGGVGVVALGAGIVLGLQAGGLEDDAFALCASPSIPCADAPEANDLNQRGRDRAVQANIAFGVAGGAAIAATVLWLTGTAAPESRVAVSPRLGTVSGLDVAVRF